MMRVHIIAIDTGHEAHVLRLAAEAWGADVTVTWVGNSDQIVAYLSGKPPHEVIIISGHGDAHSIHLPILDHAIRHRYQFADRITAGQFRDFVKLSQSHVINLACEAGGPDFARVFLECGASSYIGSTIAPDGSAALMYALELLYGLLAEKMSIGEAHQKASHHNDDRQTFEVYNVEHGSSGKSGESAHHEG